MGNKQDSSSSKKSTVTLAIDKLTLDIIRKDSEDLGLSVNSKINKILSRYAYFSKYIEFQYPVTITSRNLQFILDNVDESILAKIFQTIIIHLIPPVLYEKGVSSSLDDWMTHLCKGILLNAGMIQKFSSYKDQDGHQCMVFTHTHGIKWSRIFGMTLSQLLRQFMDYHSEPTILPSSLKLKILERNM